MPVLQRSDAQPPCSSWAEETILSDCLRDPALIDRIGDIGTELVFPEFRRIWQAMMRARTRGADPARWYSAVHAELERAECGNKHDEHWYRAVESECSKGLDITHPLSAWWACKAKTLLALLNSGSLIPAELDYALVLLHRCTEARAIANEAMEIANHAWLVPDRAFDAVRTRQAISASQSKLRGYAGADDPAPPTVAPPVWERPDVVRI